MNLKNLVTSLIIPLLKLQGVCSIFDDFSSGIANYHRLNIKGNYSYLASVCGGELFSGCLLHCF